MKRSRVDWARFEDLPGAPDVNFEALCRALIRLHYGRFGVFRATAQMPGIEFHLKLHDSCPLGGPGRWFGWQCRWYNNRSGTSLGTKRREKVVEAIRTTERTLPELTDWVLWTRHPLTAGDDKWFHKLKAKFRLHAKDSSYAEDLLSGDALVFRETYFGDLVLLPDVLADLHRRSVASIHTRWLHEAHQRVDVERSLRRALGESLSWGEALEIAAQLERSVEAIRSTQAVPPELCDCMQEFTATLVRLIDVLRALPSLLDNGDFDLLRQTLELRPEALSPVLRGLPRRLRALRHSLNFQVTNACVRYEAGRRLIDDVHRVLNTRIYAVLADAGGGKTQLAAELTSAQSDRPAGILLHGRDLKAGDNLDDLANRFTICGKPSPSFEALVASLDAASQRARRRLPLFIDGLNEAEDPRDWKKTLSEARTLLEKYVGVLLVVTLRTGARRFVSEDPFLAGIENEETEGERMVFVRMALPEGTQVLAMDGFGTHTEEAMMRYFRHFRINAKVGDVFTDMLEHPLTLRMFCEIANPPPQTREVGPEALPRSLVQLFSRYVDGAIERIGVLSPRAMAYSGQDVRRALNRFATELWVQNKREIDQHEFRVIIGDDQRIWDHSVVKLMEQEGLILRVAKSAEGRYGIIPVYDAIGGYYIANALVAEMGLSDYREWIKAPETLRRFRSDVWNDLHPLANDVFRALAALTPKRFQQEQLWNLVPLPLKRTALLEATLLEGDLLDHATIEEIAVLLKDPAEPPVIFQHLRRTRSIPRHPLNAIFLDTQLRAMTNGARDLRWTEMIRRGYISDYGRTPRLGAVWETDRTMRSESDRLKAIWMMWLLTSTALEIRAKATRALYWCGRSDPGMLFTLALSSLTIEDPYVPERMLAACYGVVMERHGVERDSGYAKTVLREFARALYDKMFAFEAPHATTHVLMREYARRIIEVGVIANRSLLSAAELVRVRPPYPKDLHRKWPEIAVDEDERSPRRSPLGMDFKNYTIGRLVPERGNYDFRHDAFRGVVAQIVGRVHELGWTADAFDKIDASISSDTFRRQRRENSSFKVERYGKKYSRVAYNEQCGMRQDLGLIQRSYRRDCDRSSDVDIDPSFPKPRYKTRLTSENWLRGEHKSLSEWISRGSVPDSCAILVKAAISEQPGPWVLLDGYFTQEDKISGRDVFCFVQTFLVNRAEQKEVTRILEEADVHGATLPRKPSVLFAYAGEFPWCSTFPADHRTVLRHVVHREEVAVVRRREVIDERAVENLRKVLELCRAGKPIPSELLSQSKGLVTRRLVRSREIREKAVEFKITIPVCDFHWEGLTMDDESVSGVVLAKHIAKTLDLRWIPGTRDVADRRGLRATFNTDFSENGRQNRQQGFFFRKDLLSKYLRAKGQVLIWVCWGERGIAHHLVDRLDRDKFGPTFKVFKTVKTLDVK